MLSLRLAKRRKAKLPFIDQMLYMARESMVELPSHELPPEYSFSVFCDDGCDRWYELFHHAEPVFDINDGLLEQQFDEHLDSLRERCLFLMRGEVVVGSAIGWWNRDFLGERRGVLRLFAIHPNFQRKGLARPLLARTLRRLKESDQKCHLATYPERVTAIQDTKF